VQHHRPKAFCRSDKPTPAFDGSEKCGKSTLALKFAWQTQGAFDAVVFQVCGQRAVAEIAAELASKLRLGL
jgi:hypothetical protein